MQNDLAGEERHGQALARALRVPDDATAPVPVRTRRLDGGLNRLEHRVILVIARDLLDDAPVFLLEHHEMVHVFQEPPFVQQARQEYLKLRYARRRGLVALDRPPGHEALFVGCQRADPRLQAVRDDQDFVVRKEGWNLVLVRLQLAERGPEGGVLVDGVLQLDHHQRKAVDENHDVGPSVVLIFDHRELIHRQPVVLVGEIEQPRLVVDGAAVLPLVLDVHTVGQKAMKRSVRPHQGRLAQMGDLAKRLLLRLGR